MSVKIVRCVSVSFKQLILLISIMLIIYSFPAAAEQTSPEPERKIQFAPEAEKGADQLFKDAGAAAEKNPEEAIRLYRRALQSKPDAWAERKRMALLYEKLGKTDAAVAEYELINRAVDSAQSNADLTRILEKRGVLPAAASIALHGAQKFPDDRVLTLYAGDLLLKTGQTDMALEFIKRAAQNKPDDKEIMFLLGRAYENKGNGAAALRAYLKSIDTGVKSDKHEKVFQRLASRAVRVEDLWFFLPQGWERDRNMLINTIEAQRVYVEVHPAGDINAIALKSVKERMPPGMFSDEQLKGYEEMRKMASEMSKATPDAAKGLMIGRLPVLITKSLDQKFKGLLVLASSSGEPSELIQSACTLALRSGIRIYTVTSVSSKQYQEGEKALLSLIDYIVLPL